MTLIVEDEPLIALEMHDAFQMAGASILAATNIEEALELISYARICAAIVDVDLGGRDCSSVCAALTKRSIPFMFNTGYVEALPLTVWNRVPALSKPTPTGTIIDTILQLLPS